MTHKRKILEYEEPAIVKKRLISDHDASEHVTCALSDYSCYSGLSNAPESPSLGAQIVDLGLAEIPIPLHHQIDYQSIDFLKSIGSGCFADVWSGTLDNEENVAVKVAKLSTTGGGTTLQSFLNEAIMLSKANEDENPFVVNFLGMSKTPKICILTELMDCSLYDLIHKKKEQFDLRKIVQIVLDISSGLNHLHTKSKILHNDVTSKNILYASYSSKKRGLNGCDAPTTHKKDFSVKLADLGLSTFVPGDDAQEEEKRKFCGFRRFSNPVGNARWRSPEGTKSNQSTEKSDCYSFGVVFWELLTNKVPFEEISDPKQAAWRVAFEGLQLQLPDDLPLQLSTLLKSCLDHDPTKRPSMSEVCKILKRYLACTSPTTL